MRIVEGVATVSDVDAFVADLAEIAEQFDSTVQAFDARYVVDRTHLRRAVALADRAIERDENVARDRAVEILLYAAGRRQINRALTMGVGEGETPVVVLVDGGDVDGAAGTVESRLEPAETLGGYDPELVREFFAVSDAELRATDGDLPDVVHERVALLDVDK
ncbi:KEOPS complex subunit Cgi121 [Haloarculaceae archaeon H-GB2-1]|nr:KEOPS complex subunit Cgi121 [Haloarculaceae archaeon H-GB1-1]MEA5388791.1 KEOPS complex subunit Cgi121 [Haloarculaceae archaeon H-GB11]MEA5406847.1 KEOPS complex subunit Cgi121 [Haloarculaceae archaeon H-GB2-1]